jgi:hypothetical protein
LLDNLTLGVNLLVNLDGGRSNVGSSGQLQELLNVGDLFLLWLLVYSSRQLEIRIGGHRSKRSTRLTYKKSSMTALPPCGKSHFISPTYSHCILYFVVS